MPNIIKNKIIKKYKFLSIENYKIKFKNQNRIFTRIKFKNNESSIIIPIIKKKIIFIKEYGMGIKKYYLSLPKGGIKKKENPLEAANREMMEEIGYASKKIKFLKTIFTSASYSNTKTHIFIAKNLYKKQIQYDEPEKPKIIKIKIKNIKKIIKKNILQDSRSISALFVLKINNYI